MEALRSYESYKLIHLASIFLLIAFTTASFTLVKMPKWGKITMGLVSLMVFVGGMGLMARLGIGHGGGWPGWIHAKITLWLVISAGVPILAKRAPHLAKIWLPLFLLLFITAAGVVTWMR